MTSPVAVGVIGVGRRASSLSEYAAPLSGAVIAAIAPGPRGRDRTAAAGLARHLGAAFRREWESVATDPAVGVVLIEDARAAAAETALAAGKIVVCPGPPARILETLERLSAAAKRGRGALLAAGEIRYTPAGSRAVAIAAEGGLGVLHSIYAAVRLPVLERPDGEGTILERAGWDVLDTVCAAVPRRPARVSATVTGLFGGAADTAVVIAWLGDDTIVTVELSSCLPASIPTVAQGEVEIEMIGSREALRIEPYKTAVRFHGQRDSVLLPWIDDPVLSMLHEAISAARGEAAKPNHFDHWRRVIGFMEAIKSSAARGEPVTAS